MKINEEVLPPFKVAGISARTNNADESESSKTKIMPLYKKFFSENIESQIPDGINKNNFMGLYTDYESDVKGDYTIIICKEVNSLENIPESLNTHDIAEAKYLKFTDEGEMPGVVINAWKYIWSFFSENKKYERAYTTDFEKYDVTNYNKVEIYISIK